MISPLCFLLEVCYGFIVYGPDGNQLDYEDDMTGSLEVICAVPVEASV